MPKNQMPEIARKILDFIADREDDCGRLSNYEILLCRIDGDIYADEGLPYLLSKHLIDIPDPDALTTRTLRTGRSSFPKSFRPYHLMTLPLQESTLAKRCCPKSNPRS